MSYVRCVSHEWWCDRDGCQEDVSVIEQSVITARARVEELGWIVLKTGPAWCPKHAGDDTDLPDLGPDAPRDHNRHAMYSDTYLVEEET